MENIIIGAVLDANEDLEIYSVTKHNIDFDEFLFILFYQPALLNSHYFLTSQSGDGIEGGNEPHYRNHCIKNGQTKEYFQRGRKGDPHPHCDTHATRSRLLNTNTDSKPIS